MRIAVPGGATPVGSGPTPGADRDGATRSARQDSVGSGPAWFGPALAAAMRPRIPPLLPTYFLLVLVVVFAVGSLWIGLERLDAIERIADSRADSALTGQELQSLRSMVSDIVNSSQ